MTTKLTAAKVANAGAEARETPGGASGDPTTHRPPPPAAARPPTRPRHRRQRKSRLLLRRLQRSELDAEGPVGIARARGPVAELVVSLEVVLDDVPRRGWQVPAPLALLTLHRLHVDRLF